MCWEKTPGAPRALLSVVDSTGWVLKRKMTQEMWFCAMSKDCVPRSWILVFGREPEIRIMGAQKGLRRQALLPMRGCGMQALRISNPFPSSWSSPLFFEDLGTGQQGEKWIACSGFSESAVAESPAFGIGGLFSSIALPVLICGSATAPRRAPAHLVSSTGAGEPRAPYGIGPVWEISDLLGEEAGAVPKALVQPPDLARRQRRGEETGEMGTFCKLFFLPVPSHRLWAGSCPACVGSE